jgi:hypothetical protein
MRLLRHRTGKRQTQYRAAVPLADVTVAALQPSNAAVRATAHFLGPQDRFYDPLFLLALFGVGL